MDLSNLKAPKPNQKNRKRIGRGKGSGTGGHTVGRGRDGQRSRSGFNEKFWFEGGQMPLQRRIPKFGFKNRFRISYTALNIGTLAQFVEDGKLDESIGIDALIEAGLVGKNERVKLLGEGEIDRKVEIEVHACSKSAREKMEKAGGSVTVIGK